MKTLDKLQKIGNNEYREAVPRNALLETTLNSLNKFSENLN